MHGCGNATKIACLSLSTPRPISSVQRALMELLFQPAEQATSSARRRHSDNIGSGEKKRLAGDRDGDMRNVGSSHEREEVG